MTIVTVTVGMVKVGMVSHHPDIRHSIWAIDHLPNTIKDTIIIEEGLLQDTLTNTTIEAQTNTTIVAHLLKEVSIQELLDLQLQRLVFPKRCS
jgi:hypothetical protein